MKTNDPLDDLLQRWQSPDRVPGDFREQVWHRIAATADDPANPSVRPFRTRVTALAAVAAVIVASFGLGMLTGDESESGERDAYFTRINPITKAR